jgi:hypothetical protein
VEARIIHVHLQGEEVAVKYTREGVNGTEMNCYVSCKMFVRESGPVLHVTVVARVPLMNPNPGKRLILYSLELRAGKTSSRYPITNLRSKRKDPMLQVSKKKQ